MNQCPSVPSSFVRATNGKWINDITSAPKFPLPSHIIANPSDRDHFFIPVTLSFPNHSNINTYAFIDSGATNSHISETFVRRHSIPKKMKTESIPIYTVDDRPLASGLLTHDVITQISIRDHTEITQLGIVNMPYPVLLGLDWLKQHNPAVDWARGQLLLSCCGVNHQSPVSAMGKGYSLISPVVSSQSISVTSVGLGLRLNNLKPPSLLESRESSLKPTPSFSGNFSNFPALSSILRPPPPNGPSRAELLAIWSLPPPAQISSTTSYDIAFVDPPRFHKYAKNLQCGCIWYTPNKSIIPRINSLHPTPPPQSPPETPPEPPPISLPDDSSDPEEEVRKLVPTKYHAYLDVFSPTEVKKLPQHRSYDVNIDLEEGKTPPFGPIYSLSIDERKAVFDYVEEHLAKGFIRRSTSSAASPILFIKRKTGDLRLCVDYRGLNAITKKNRYPLPLTHDLIDRLQGCNKFTVIDLKNAFNLIRVKEGDEWKTAFRTHLGLFEYTVMPFGLTNAPATFQSFIQDTLRDILDISTVVYLDDILTFSGPGQDHDALVIQVLERLRRADLFANAKKCEFDKSSVEYLGFIISSQGIQMNPKKFKTITDWPLPTTVKQIQSFLGFTNFYRRFIHHYADLALPLNSLTTKDHKLSFKGLTEPAKEAFHRIKLAFVTAPLLQHFNPTLPSTLITDASDFAFASILLQPDKQNLLHPTSYYSRKFTPSEINYEIHDKELLAIVDSFRDMRSWLISSPHPISVISDHKNLEYFMTSRILNRRQARWAMFLSEYDFKLDFAPGTKNPADGPSRRPDFIPHKGDEVIEFQNQALLTDNHLERLFPRNKPPSPLSLNPTINSLSTFTLDNSELLENFKTAFRLDTEWRDSFTKPNSLFTFQDNLVFHDNRLFVPHSLRSQIVFSRHNAVLAGHPGRAGTYDLVKRDFSWPGMRRYIRSYVSSCEHCARIKHSTHKPYGLLQPLDIPDRPWKSITMDFIVKLPPSHGYDAIWVICDRMTRAAHFIPIQETMDAPELARLYLDRVFRHHGFPQAIISDRGSIFVSSFFTQLMKICGVKMKPSTAFHPQTDGLTERTNQTLETYLRAYCSYQQDDWVDYLALAEFVFNNTLNSSTQQTPFFANIGYHPDFDIVITERTTNPSATEFTKRLQVIRDELQAELSHSNDYISKYYNQHHLPAPQFSQGDKVWLIRRNIKTMRPSNKLDYKKIGPYEVIERRGKSSYLLKLPTSLKRLHPVFHVSLLEPFIDPSIIPDRPSESTSTQVELGPNTLINPEISTILDSRKIGRRYDYLIHWKNSLPSENSWIPFAEISSSLYPQLEQFHRKNPSLPHPPRFLILENTSVSDSVSISVPSNITRSSTPPPEPWTRDYEPPVHTITRSGRQVHPPKPKDQ